MSLYIGLMSGTSMDGIDAALVDIGADGIELISYLQCPYPETLRDALGVSTRADPELPLRKLMTLHIDVGTAFAAAVQALLETAGVSAAAITAIGSHGQTLLHSPDTAPPFTLQIGDAATIAVRTGITTVADFRSVDIAAGGQGAPLAPAFHAFAFRHTDRDRVVVNIGGIANATFLPGGDSGAVSAYDTGPGNCLMDEWIRTAQGSAFDAGGRYAASGTALPALLERMLEEPYFRRPPPKSTGRDLFNAGWLRAFSPADHAPADIQATLAALTVRTIAEAVQRSGLAAPELLICGGGAANPVLLAGLAAALPDSRVGSTGEYGLAPDRIEACAFAWMANNRLNNIAFPSEITGAARSLVLGAVYRPG